MIPIDQAGFHAMRKQGRTVMALWRSSEIFTEHVLDKHTHTHHSDSDITSHGHLFSVSFSFPSVAFVEIAEVFPCWT